MSKRSIVVIALILLAVLVSIFINIFSSGSGDLITADKNDNGIWDDYEAVLNEKYASSPNLKNAALHTGKSIQAVLDLSDIVEKDKVFSKSMSCLVATGIQEGLSFEEATDLIDQVRDAVLSNDARQLQYIKYNGAVSGKVLPVEMPDIKNCEFEVAGVRK